MKKENYHKNNWVFTFLPAYNILIADLIARSTILTLTLTNNDIIDVRTNLFLQILITAFTLWFTNRKVKGIKSFLSMRLLSESNNLSDKNTVIYSETKVHLLTTSLKDNGILLIILVFIPLLATISILPQFESLTIILGNNNREIIGFGIATFWFSGYLALYLLTYKKFISNKIVSIERNNLIFNNIERTEIIEFLNRNLSIKSGLALNEQNDFLIIDLQTRLKIYRERLENLSLEGIFLGALTFATFTQFISPESMNLLGTDPEQIKNDLFGGISVYAETINDPSKWMIDNHLNSKFALAVITFGSLVSSTLYLIVLIKRFTILKMIELAQLRVERSNVWNQREEKEIAAKQKNFAIKYTDQIQIELSEANQMAENILSNINLTSWIRTGGITAFFIILLVSAEMIEHELFVILTTFTIYGVMANFLMNIDERIKQIFTRNKVIDRFRNANDKKE